VAGGERGITSPCRIFRSSRVSLIFRLWRLWQVCALSRRLWTRILLWRLSPVFRLFRGSRSGLRDDGHVFRCVDRARGLRDRREISPPRLVAATDWRFRREL